MDDPLFGGLPFLKQHPGGRYNAPAGRGDAPRPGPDQEARMHHLLVFVVFRPRPDPTPATQGGGR